MNNSLPNNFISLRQATKYCDYSPDYLKLRAYQKKLKAIKFGRHWMTKKEWLEEYLKTVEEYNNNFRKKQSEFKFQLTPSPILLLMVGALLTASTVFGKTSFQNVYQDLDPYVLEISEVGISFASDYAKIIQSVYQDAVSLPTIVQEFNDNFNQRIITLNLNFKSPNLSSIATIDQFLNLKSSYFSLNNLLEEKIFEFGKLVLEKTKKAPELLVKTYQTTNNFLEQKLSAFREQFSETLARFSQAITQPFVRGYQIVTSPWRLPPLEKEKVVVEEKIDKEKLESLQKEVQELKEKGLTIKEITKEVSRITQIQPVKEIFRETVRETIITRVGEEALLELRTLIDSQAKYQANQITGIQVELARRPTGFVASPTIIQPVTQQANLTKLYNERGEVRIETSGSGNIILSSAGNIVVSGSTLQLGATLALTAAQTIAASIDSTLLTVTQSGTGNIVDFKDDTTTVFSIADGGYATLAVDASTTPSFVIKALGISPTFSTSTYFGIVATSTFAGFLVDFQKDGTSYFVIDSSGNVAIATTTPSHLFSVATSTDILVVTNYGYVGIASTSPTEALTVSGNILGSGNIVLTDENSTSSIAGYFYSQATTTLGSSTSTATILTGYIQSDIIPYSADTYILGSSDYKWQNIYVATATIGSTITINSTDITASGALNLTGASASTWTLTGLTIQSTGDIIATSTSDIILTLGDTAGAKAFYITDSTGATTTSLFTVASDGKVGIATTTLAGLFTVGTTSDAILNITTEGYLGLGTSAPTSTLSIVGGLNASGNLEILGVSTLGTNFYVDSSGNASTTGDLLIDTSTFYVDSANNAVSIGTTTFSGLFSIATSTATSSDILFNITTEGDLAAGILIDNEGRLVYGSDLFYVNTPSQAVAIGTSTAAGIFTVGTTTGTAILNITTEGNVGIGTTEPIKLLHVNQNVADVNLRLTGTRTSDGSFAYISFANNGVDSGFYDQATISPIRDGADAAIGLAFATRTATNTNATERMRITSTGNVGIGTTNPNPESFGADYTILALKGKADRYMGLLYLQSKGPVAGDEAGDIFGMSEDTRIARIQFDSDDTNASSGVINFFTSALGTENASPIMTIASSTNVGIGTTAPTSPLHVVNTTAGDTQLIKVTGTTNVVGGFFQYSTGADQDRLGLYLYYGAGARLWVDESLNFRIHNADPDTHTAGTVVGTQTSSLDTKNVSGQFTDYTGALNTILNTNLYNFTYKSGSFKNQEFTGIISDYSPTFGMDVDATHPNGKSFNPITAFGYTVGAIKAINNAIQEQQAEIEELKSYLSVGTNSSGQIVNLDPEQLRAGLAVLGLTVNENGILEVQKLKAEEIEIGSQTQPNGITIYDEDTGEPYCLKMKSGQMVSITGKCYESTSSEPTAIEVTSVSPIESNATNSTDSVATSSENGGI